MEKFNNLASSKKHVFWRGRVFAIDVYINPNDPDTDDNKYTLLNEDGSVHQELSLSDDAIAGDDKLTLIFSGLSATEKYSLEIDDGEDDKYFAFYKVKLEELLDVEINAGEVYAQDYDDDVNMNDEDLENEEDYDDLAISEEELFSEEDGSQGSSGYEIPTEEFQITDRAEDILA